MRKRRVPALSTAAVLIVVAACTAFSEVHDAAEPSSDAGTGDGVDGGAEDALPNPSGDASRDGGGDSSREPDLPQPDSRCLMATTSTADVSINVSQSPVPAGSPVEVIVQSNTGYTNVNLAICSPDSGALVAQDPDTTMGFFPTTWTFELGGLPRGVTQIGFRADPDASTPYQTVLIEAH
jgi:hypothetical protein